MVGVNVDLAVERAVSQLKSEEVAVWFAGGQEQLETRRELAKLFFDDPVLQDEKHHAYMSHAEFFEHETKKGAHFLAKFLRWFNKRYAGQPLDLAMVHEFHLYVAGEVGFTLFTQRSPLGLHHSMFLIMLLSNASEEQQKVWLPKAWKMQGWIGTYAQTEVGHGTFIRGLETRVDYDIENQEFVINTPSLTAYKWWPGSLGNVANIMVLIAPLFINGKSCGLQSFLVPIRDPETHQPLPGVDVGEIGPKVGLNGPNNGFLGLKNVRVPLGNMLMRHAQVLPNGKFIAKSEPVLLYSTMMFIRVGIVQEVSYFLSVAATIATRYSIVRQQSPIGQSRSEPKILEHFTQRVKIFPQIAKAIIFKLTAKRLWNEFERTTRQLASGEYSNLAELHAVSCALKAITTSESASDIEVLRRACGGHGFLQSAGFGTLYANVNAACTYEGENTVLLLQSARFLMKQVQALAKGKQLTGSTSYLGRMDQKLLIQSNLQGLDLIKLLVSILEQATAGLVKYANQRSSEKRGSEAGPILTQAATAYGHCHLINVALSEITDLNSQPLSATLKKVLSEIYELYVVDTFLRNLHHILRFYPHLCGTQITTLETRFEQLLTLLRPNILALVDGFAFHDRALQSTLGAYDGRVYERLMEAARKSPLNQQPVHPVFHSHLKPLMQGKL